MEATKELNAKMAEFEKTNKSLEDSLKGKATSEQITEMKSAHEKLGTDIEKLNSEIERMGNSFKEQRASKKSFGSILSEAITPDFL